MDIKSHTHPCPLCHQIIYLGEHHDCSSYFQTPKKLPVTEQMLYDRYRESHKELNSYINNDILDNALDEFQGGVDSRVVVNPKSIYDEIESQNTSKNIDS